MTTARVESPKEQSNKADQVSGNGQSIPRANILLAYQRPPRLTTPIIINGIAALYIWLEVCIFSDYMDIARPEFKRQKRKRQFIWGAIGLVCLGAVTVGVSRLKPAAPEVERSTVWTDTVKRGPMLRQVRGLGSLIPSQEFTRQIPAETEATVVRIQKLPGSQVKADTILL